MAKARTVFSWGGLKVHEPIVLLAARQRFGVRGIIEAGLVRFDLQEKLVLEIEQSQPIALGVLRFGPGKRGSVAEDGGSLKGSDSGLLFRGSRARAKDACAGSFALAQFLDPIENR